jgi:uncharacterized membrane protein YkvA (DUF1232 family)
MNFNLQSLHNWYRTLLQNPKYRWWVVGASLIYLVSPIDLAPDFIPFVGLIDDTLIISLLVSEVALIAKAKLQTQNTRSSKSSSNVSDQTIDIQAMAAD